MRITFKTLAGKNYQLEAAKSDPIYNLKKKFDEFYGIPIQQQIFLFRGKVLDDGMLLGECGIEDGGTLNLLVNYAKSAVKDRSRAAAAKSRQKY